MTAQEAIEAIKSNKPTSGYIVLCEALDIAIEALEKQSKLERVIERLEETMRERVLTAHSTSDVFVDGQANGLEWAIEIIKEEMM